MMKGRNRGSVIVLFGLFLLTVLINNVTVPSNAYAGTSTAVKTTTPTPTTTSNLAPLYLSYTVVKGDSLYSIAKNYGTTMESIKSINKLSSDSVSPGQVLKLNVAQSKALKDIMAAKGINVKDPKINIVVDKSDDTLSVYSNGVWLKTYHVETGLGGLNDKQVEGDRKTPEGTFYITERYTMNPEVEYLGTRWMRLSYPNIEDADRGLKQGIIDQKTHDSIVYAINHGLTPPQDTALGGAIGVHGGSTTQLGTNWTWGCVGLSNKDVQDFYDFTRVGTKVVINR